MDKMKVLDSTAVDRVAISLSGSATDLFKQPAYVTGGDSQVKGQDIELSQVKKTMADKVADYIIWFSHQRGDLITNLKLQKLVYYAQAWYLALYDKPLFDDEFQAWVHGPVLVRLYHRFKHYRWRPIDYDPGEVDLPKEVKEHIEDVLRVFGDYSAYNLERMVHTEDPWLNARGGLPADEASRNIISKEDMKVFYKKLADG